MAETETAVLEPEATEVAPDLEDTAATLLETEGEPTPEPETEPERLSKEEVDRLVAQERQKAIEEIKAEAEDNARTENAKRRRTAASQIRTGKAYNEFQTLTKQVYAAAEQGIPLQQFEFNINSQYGRAIGEHDAAIFQEQADLIRQATEDEADKTGFKIPRELTRRMERALFNDPNLWNPSEFVAAQKDVLRLLIRAEDGPKIREEIEAELRDERKTQGLKDTDEKRKASARPTEVAGTPAIPSTARAILDSLSPADPKWRAAYKQVHGIDPPR